MYIYLYININTYMYIYICVYIYIHIGSPIQTSNKQYDGKWVVLDADDGQVYTYICI
jgi:hypothetical protein